MKTQKKAYRKINRIPISLAFLEQGFQNKK